MMHDTLYLFASLLIRIVDAMQLDKVKELDSQEAYKALLQVFDALTKMGGGVLAIPTKACCMSGFSFWVSNRVLISTYSTINLFVNIMESSYSKAM